MWNLGLRLFAGFGLLALLIVAGVYFWQRPEKWNGTAHSYKTHAGKLSVDSARWYKDSTGFRLVIANKNALIDTLTRVAKDAQQYAGQWEEKYNGQVTKSDAATDKLTDKQREVAYYKALIANGTLASSGLDIARLTPATPLVVSAGLKTANREAIGSRSLDSLSDAVGYLKVSNQRLRAGLAYAGGKVSALANSATNSKHGGIWPFNAKRRRQLQAAADSATVIVNDVNQISDLEKRLNGKP